MSKTFKIILAIAVVYFVLIAVPLVIADRGTSLAKSWKLVNPGSIALLMGAASWWLLKKKDGQVEEPKTPPIVWILLALMLIGSVAQYFLPTAPVSSQGVSNNVAAASRSGSRISHSAAAPEGNHPVTPAPVSAAVQDPTSISDGQHAWILEVIYSRKSPDVSLTYMTREACEHMIAALSDPNFRVKGIRLPDGPIGMKCVESAVMSQ